MSDEPFEIRRRDRDVVVVQFSSICNVRRTASHEAILGGLLGETELLILDLSGTIAMSTTWWRYIGTLAQRARREGRRFVVAGLGETLAATADAIGVLGMISTAATVEEASR